CKRPQRSVAPRAVRQDHGKSKQRHVPTLCRRWKHEIKYPVRQRITVRHLERPAALPDLTEALHRQSRGSRRGGEIGLELDVEAEIGLADSKTGQLPHDPKESR